MSNSQEHNAKCHVYAEIYMYIPLLVRLLMVVVSMRLLLIEETAIDIQSSSFPAGFSPFPPAWGGVQAAGLPASMR
jgi:hypothetical protein